MFWKLIDPNVKTIFIPFVNGIALPEISFLFWLLAFFGLLMSISIHEYAHALMAYKLGDKTAYYQNRLNINPINHFDIFGLLLITFTFFGYGKPVPVNPNNLENPYKGIFLISFAGPVSNIFIAITVGLIYLLLKNFFRFDDSNTLTDIFLSLISTIIHTLPYIGAINIAFAVFNLIPLYPLDGSKIITYVSQDLAYFFEKYVFPYSFYLIILLILPIFNGKPLISLVITPIINAYLIILSLV